MKKTYLQPDNVPKPAGDYSHGLVIEGGKLVMISGQVPWGVDGKLVSEDFGEQTRQVLENLNNMLAAAGATFADVIKLTIFLKEREDFMIFKDIRAEYLKAPFPPTTLLVVKDLARAEWKLEVEVVAMVD